MLSEPSSHYCLLISLIVCGFVMALFLAAFQLLDLNCNVKCINVCMYGIMYCLLFSVGK